MSHKTAFKRKSKTHLRCSGGIVSITKISSYANALVRTSFSVVSGLRIDLPTYKNKVEYAIIIEIIINAPNI